MSSRADRLSSAVSVDSSRPGSSACDCDAVIGRGSRRRETPYYSARERAALEWTEALTLVSETRVPDDAYERVLKPTSEGGEHGDTAVLGGLASMAGRWRVPDGSAGA